MHPDFEPLIDSWDLSLRADDYSPNTRAAYDQAVRRLGRWMNEHAPDAGPADLNRNHVRGWLADLREHTSANTARGWFAGVRHFSRWLVAEGELTEDATLGIRTPSAGDPSTPTLRDDQITAMLATCAGTGFVERRDAAIIYVFFDGGVRLAEHTGLKVDDFDVRDRMLFVAGKGSNRSGPRRRAVQLGVKAARALDRYLRERRRHPFHELPELWLGGRGRGAMGAHGIKAVVQRRAAQAGIDHLHPHMFRHTWASEFRRAGGEEGDLMVLGGWRSRQMLDRYGKAAADDRARASYRSRSLGDRL
jgi:site-specific recombinase XerD